MFYKINFGALLFLFSISIVLAHSGGGAGSSTPQERRVLVVSEPQFDDGLKVKDVNGKLIQEKIVDGFLLRFKVVDVEDSVPDGGSHNLLVNIQREGRIQYNLSVDASIVNRNDEKKSKSMMELGDWYLVGYDFHSEEEYTIIVSFTAKDGVVHSSTIHYPD